jgi:microcystin-dependent protein
MPEPFIGEVRMFAGSIVPTGWALCNGQLVPIAQNVALFSILGTAFGGDGQVTFALPDLQGRVPVHPGQGPGLSNRTRGQALGSEAHTLGLAEMPAHTHSLGASANGISNSPAGRVLAQSPAAIPQFEASADTALSASAVTTTGADQPHNNMQPYLTFYFCIALQGVFPPRT